MSPQRPTDHPQHDSSDGRPSGGLSRGGKRAPRSTLERIGRFFMICFTGTQSGNSDMTPPSKPQTLHNQQMPSLPEIVGNSLEPQYRYGNPHHGTQARYHTDTSAMAPIANTGHHPRPPPGLGRQGSAMPQQASPGTEITIAMMGVTGAGKSYFIREVSGNSEVVVSGDLYSCTREVLSYSFEYEGVKITLVDTPGFNDASRSDTEVLQEIADWTSAAYRDKQLLSGIIYLHPITHARMEGSALKNLRMFQSLCGRTFLKNVFLTTTQWSNVDPAEGEVRENSLRNGDLWGGLIDKGATLQRFHGTRESGLELIRGLMLNEPELLDIQAQIVDQHMTLPETDAGKCINEELIAQENRQKEEIEFLERERQEAIKSMDNETKEILMAEQAKVRKNLDKVATEKRLLAELHAAEIKRPEARIR